ncbi:MAG: FAD-binding oxidoreductase [Thermoleophilaceae bacterium]
MTEPATPALPLDDLRASLAGRVLTSAEPGYERAREVFNMAFDLRPALIARPVGADDIAAAIAFARDTGLELAIKGGGHGMAGHGATDGGLLLDMSDMKGIEIDPHARTAWSQAGLTAGEYTDAAARHGLATGFGDTGSVGIAGITLGGGIGWLVRKHGLTIDSLLAAELMTVDGELVRADADSHSDLFWALRGGGGNFGVVTRLQYRLEEVDGILAGLFVLPATAENLRRFIDAAAQAPDELTIISHVAPAPPAPFLPPEQHGKLVLMGMFAYAGDPGAGERAIEPIRSIATPIAEIVRPVRYPEIFGLFGEGPPRVAMATRTSFSDDIDEATAAAIVERVRTAPVRGAVQMRVLGGAMARVPAGATAFAHRDRRVMVITGAMGDDPAQAPDLDGWAHETAAALGLYGNGAYVNYLADEPERVREAYPDATYERLARVKAQYDPDNVFRVNQNIAPAA